MIKRESDLWERLSQIRSALANPFCETAAAKKLNNERTKIIAEINRIRTRPGWEG